MFKAIIFDMDGLMVDTERLYIQTMRQVARRYGKEVGDDTLARMMGRAPLESIRIYVRELELPDSPEDILERRERMMMELFAHDLSPMPGLMELLGELAPRPSLSSILDPLSSSSGVPLAACPPVPPPRLAIATGSPRKFVDVILPALSILDRFDVIVTGDQITRGKPDPEIYLRAAGRLELPPKDCIVLEDSANGVLAGKAAGCHTIAVPGEHTRDQDFSSADFIAKDLTDAGRHIRGLRSAMA